MARSGSASILFSVREMQVNPSSWPAQWERLRRVRRDVCPGPSSRILVLALHGSMVRGPNLALSGQLRTSCGVPALDDGDDGGPFHHRVVADLPPIEGRPLPQAHALD